jgi:uncharacterized glyoxalase superfamily protein PhnB
MLHVPDVRAAVDWYVSVAGFAAVDQAGHDGEIDWAMLRFGDSLLMLSNNGTTSSAHRREVDLYVHVENFDDLYHQIKDHVDVVEAPHDTFYGMREFIIRDLNRFWVTFACPVAR